MALLPAVGWCGAMEAAAQRFAESDFVFARGRSDIPFVPLAWVDSTVYDQSRFLLPSGKTSEISFEQKTISQGGLLPLLLGRRDALVVGEWLSWTRFDLSDGSDKEVISIGIPIGWAHQSSPDWQIAAFIAPLGHASQDDDWYWEFMGGIFARWLQNDHFTWLFGLYADVTSLEEYYIPYAGLTWTINQHWTLSAVMPWPALLYSPDQNWLIRLGVSPSDASWSADVDVQGDPKKPQLNFGSWNFGLRVERRVWHNFWVGAAAGLAGLRGFTFAGTEWEGPNTDMGSDGYVGLTINFRPVAPPMH
ncbi:MAG: hypothetical protein ACJ8OJ_04435 [Povalibacter sp.]